MQQKELRIALVCYGGISLAVYMHGVTKELWKAIRASRSFWSEEAESGGTEAVYAELLSLLETRHGLRLRVMTDIVAGASAGGVNAVFLAQAIHSGQSLEPLTDLWLERADVDVLLDPDARPWSNAAKFWAKPIVSWLLRRKDNAVSESVAPETREEVRTKLSRLIRPRWFEPPFSGIGFSRLIFEALEAMKRTRTGKPLLPAGHPLDLFVTATDFKGHLETLHLHSPPVVLESEHRLPIGFRARTPEDAGHDLASPLELVFAARATASFPGAFPPLGLGEIETLAQDKGVAWDSRDRFVERVMPEHSTQGDVGGVALIDGSVLVNAPFADAMAALHDRPAYREVDRRFVYIDPRPDAIGGKERSDPTPPGFFSVIFGSLSSIPREQPIRDNLETIEKQSRETETLRSIVSSLRPEVEQAVEKLFGKTLFFDRPTARRLASWRAKAQAAASVQSGFAYHGYMQVKFASIVQSLARTIHMSAPGLKLSSPEPIQRRIASFLATKGLDRIGALRGGASPEAIEFFRWHDLTYRIRRLRLLARRVTQEWEGGEDIAETDRDGARETIYGLLALYLEREPASWLGEDFPDLAERVFEDPGDVIGAIADRRQLVAIDSYADEVLAEAMAEMPHQLRRRLLLAYLGFPFYDTATLPLLRGEELTEFDPVKVDRISPDDAPSIRDGGTQETLRGTEFYNFGAFFSRAYRENDYLWGRLHGAERMIDLIASTLPRSQTIEKASLVRLKTKAFLAVLDEEQDRLTTDPTLIDQIRGEVLTAAETSST